MPRQRSQFCKNGHDKFITGVEDGGRCKVCRKETRRERYILNRPRLLAYSNKYYEDKREDILETKRLERLSDPEKFRSRERARYRADPEKFRQKSRKNYLKNRDRILAYGKEYNKRPHVIVAKSIYNHNYWRTNKEALRPKRDANRLAYKERAREVGRLYRESHKEELAQYNHEYGKRTRPRRRERERLNRIANPERHKAKSHNRRNAEGRLSVSDVRSIYDMSDGICCLCLGKLVEGDTHLEHVVPIARKGTNYATNVLLAHANCNNTKSSYTPLEYLLDWPRATDEYNMSEITFRCKVRSIHKRLVK